ncbi:hypothetical protein K4K59_005910 [Colletotrichum sp. SAR11_240]|nr:hypothetical protein K4K59_005910 [Colletotrichum sp. SAR11_240]
MVHLPEPLASFERVPLLFDHPSPLHLLPRLSKHIGNSSPAPIQVWIKREDCSSGIGLGGNKVRKLEYVFPSALNDGCDTIVTTGGVQSNHMRQVVAVANRLGLKTVLVPQNPPKSNPEAYDVSGNVQVNKILGAEYTAPGVTLEEAAASLRSNGRKPYIISSGASSHLYGGLGFARWAFEVVEQEQNLGVFFDFVVVPVASGGTLGGMLAGFKLADRLQSSSSNDPAKKTRERKVIGIDTYNKPAGVLEASILEIAQRTARLIGLADGVVKPDDVVLDTRYNAGTHSGWSESTAEAVRLLGRTEGIVADPIYSGRALGAILDKAKLGEFAEGENVLFVHTGGQAALAAFPNMI